MLFQYLRVIYSDNGVLIDVSLRNQDETNSLIIPMVTGEDYIYLGQHFPFNNFFIQKSVVNAVAGLMQIDYWDATAWRSAVDILDGTVNNSGVPLSKSGIVQFSPNPSYKWQITSDTTNGQFPSELSTLNIYNMYWLRIKFTATLTLTTAIKRITYAFTLSQQIDNYDAKINQYFDSFASGKTSWEDEIVTASYLVVRDLKSQGLIRETGEILRLDDVSIPTDWKTLELIYRSLGGDYKDKLKEASDQYMQALALGRFSFDVNKDAFLSKNEISNPVRGLSR